MYSNMSRIFLRWFNAREISTNDLSIFKLYIHTLEPSFESSFKRLIFKNYWVVGDNLQHFLWSLLVINISIQVNEKPTAAFSCWSPLFCRALVCVLFPPATVLFLLPKMVNFKGITCCSCFTKLSALTFHVAYLNDDSINKA